ncbi:hypothetical protein D3C71_2221180 [compost metagenome]
MPLSIGTRLSSMLWKNSLGGLLSCSIERIALSPSGTSHDSGTCNGQVIHDVLRAKRPTER